ncbi:MAG TPA: nuclear transport factor 2 family protein [Pedomonas sp.]|uniref:nuclear transport factor 2 family protein n=1 Tax=Pedomonas sp. TaxID=2976421 RepID=UPI002F40BC9C
MPNGATPGWIEAEQAFRRIAAVYARAMDRNEPELLDDILSEDIVVVGPGFTMQGLEQARQSPAMLRQMFLMTQHVVHNQTLTVEGDEARGETYCTASHILHPEGEAEAEAQGHTAYVWAIRYQDTLRKQGGAWRLARRELVVDWSEYRPVTLGLGGAA